MDEFYSIVIEGEFSSAGMRDYVAVPVTDGEHFELRTADGELVASVTRMEGGGYVNDAQAGLDEAHRYVFGDWRDAMLLGIDVKVPDADTVRMLIRER